MRLADFSDEVHEQVRQTPDPLANPHFKNLSRSLDSMPDSAYWDWCHVTEEGNRRIAEDIEGDVLDRLAKRASDRAAGRVSASGEIESVPERR